MVNFAKTWRQLRNKFSNLQSHVCRGVVLKGRSGRDVSLRPQTLPLPCYTQEMLIILSPWFVSYYKSNRAIFQINIMELDFFRKDNGTTNEDRSSSGFN